MSMEVQVAETGPCSRSLTITVPPLLVDEHLERMYRSAQQQVQVKGFRQGKVPRAMIEKKFGAQILAEAKEQMLNRFFGEACRTKELAPIGRIQIDEFEKLEVKRGAQLQFTARIDVRPAFDLKGHVGIEVPTFVGEATDEDVDNALKEIAHQKRSIQKTEDAAADGDFVKADLAFVDEGGAVVRERKGAQLNTRVAIHGTDDGAYTAAIVGLAAGKSVEIDLTFPPNFEVEAVRGKPGKVRVQALEVLRVTPAPIDDTLAQGLEFADLAGLRQDLAARIGQEKQRLGRQQQEEQCLQHLLAAHEISLPPSLVEEQMQAALGNLAHRLKEANTPDEEIEKQLKANEGDARGEAERRVRLYFVIEAVAQKEQITVGENDVEGELAAIAKANDVTAGQVREHLEQQNRMGELRLALLERKVRDFLRQNAKPVDKKGS